MNKMNPTILTLCTNEHLDGRVPLNTTTAELYLDEGTMRIIRTLTIRKRGLQVHCQLGERALNREDGSYRPGRDKRHVPCRTATALLKIWMAYPVRSTEKHQSGGFRAETRYIRVYHEDT